MPHYPVDTATVLNAVDYSRFSGILDDDREFHGVLGNEHYKLLSYFSTLFNGASIIDIRTHSGSSALALSYTTTNTVFTFDTMNKVVNQKIRERENIIFSTDNLFEAEGQEKWKDTLLAAPFIFLDLDPHNGTMELEFYMFLKKIGYKGFIVCDDIWYFKEMRDNFWYKLPYGERYDLTHLGHWSGTGIFTFNKEITFPKHDNSAWTLVTAYFDLTTRTDASDAIKKRDSAHYIQSAISTMSLPYNLVVYCESDSIEALKALRPAYLEPQTRYVVCDFEKFAFDKAGSPLPETFSTYRTKIQENRIKNPYAFDSRNTASYYLLCMSRYIMLKEVIQENPFQSTHFAWINICMERMGYKNIKHLDEALSVKRDKFSTCYIDYVPEALVLNTPEYYTRGRCSMCSGFFTGNGVNMAKACDLIEDKFLEYLALGYGHADEQLFSAVYFQNKDLFEHYYGDYQQMITNYVYVYDAAEPPIYNFIRNSYKHKDYRKCKEACEFVSRSIERGKVGCAPALLTELQGYRTLLRILA
jgi:hypothetical protein